MRGKPGHRHRSDAMPSKHSSKDRCAEPGLAGANAVRRPPCSKRQIMGFILREKGTGRELTAAEIHPMLIYAHDVTRGPVRKFIELLEGGAPVAREHRGRNVVILPTGRGYHWFRSARLPSTGTVP